MSSAADIGERLDRIEETVRALQAELAEIRELAAAPATTPVDEGPVERVVAAAPVATAAAAWRALERGLDLEALDLAEAALARAVGSADAAEIAAVAAFAAAAREEAVGPALRERLSALEGSLKEAGGPAEVQQPVPAPPVAAAIAVETPPAEEVPRAPVARVTVPPPSRGRAPERPPVAARARAWASRELTGSRLFVLGGGVLMLLGVVFLFVVAANRGWIGPGDRVVLGAVASLGILLAGLLLRRRYGRLQASLAAVGVGIAGAYTTLAAATILYGFLPSWGALLVAVGIAAVGGAIALAWDSQVLAGLALVGAAAAPGLVALDEGISAAAPAFALVVLCVSIAAAAPRRWLWLALAVAVAALSQVAWLVADSPVEDKGAIAVAGAASLVLLAGAVAWQLTAPAEGLDAVSAATVLLGAALALWAGRLLLSDARDEGIALAVAAGVYGSVALVSGRRRPDLGWVTGAAALVLAGVATADLLSGRSLSIAFAVQAAVLAGLAWRLGSPRFELSSLVYLAAGVVHVLTVELEGAVDAGDVPRTAAPALLTLGAAALLAGLLLPAARRDGRSPGLAGALEPLWDGLVRERAVIRALLVAIAVALAATGSAGLLSGRWLTITWAAAAAALGVAALAARERRLLAVAPPVLGLAVVHALVVEAPPSTLVLDRGLDALAPIPSLVALGAAAVVLALTCRFDQAGIAFLGAPAGPERVLDEHGEPLAELLRVTLLHLASVYAAWAAGLALVDVSYEWGQVGATIVWATLGLLVVARGARVASLAEILGWAVASFAYLKAIAFDWSQLAATPSATSFLAVATALLATGFLCRWLDVRPAEERVVLSLSSGTVAAASAVVALDRLVGGERPFGAALLLVVAALVGAAAPPFVRWRRGGPVWARPLAAGYWVLALAVLLLAETALTEFSATPTLTLWAATGAALALGWPLAHEPGLWIAALVVTAASTVGTIALATPPDRLVDASAHPASGFSAYLVCLAGALAVAWRAPAFVGELRAWLAGGTAVLALYGFSLLVLEVAERVSSASVETDFQRGHTALSTLLGIAALGVYVVGLARDHRTLRLAGLTLFGLALAKLFLYDLSSLSSITRAFSFLALGAVLLAAGFFAERLVHGGPGGRPGGHAGPRAV